MDIKWLQEVDLDIVTNFNEETEIAEEDVQMVTIGEIDDIDILADNGGTVDIQFGDGSIAFNVKKEWFRKME